MILHTGAEGGTYRETDSVAGINQRPLGNGFARTGNFAWRTNTVGTTAGFFSNVEFGEPHGSIHGAETGINEDTVYVRAYVIIETMPIEQASDHCTLISVNSTGAFADSNTKLSVHLNTEGYLLVYGEAETLLLGTSEFSLETYRTYMIEVLCDTGNPSDWELRVDGDTWLSGNDDTGTNQVAKVYFGPRHDSGDVEVAIIFDDIMIRTDDWCGPGRIYALRPIEAGHYSEWSAPLDFMDVRKSKMTSTGVGGTAHVSNTASGANQRLTFKLDKPSDIDIQGEIVSVAFHVFSVISGSAAVNLMIRSGGTDHHFSADSGEGRMSAYTEVDPTDSQPWTREKLENLEVGARHISGTGDVFLISIYAMVATEVLE